VPQTATTTKGKMVKQATRTFTDSEYGEVIAGVTRVVADHDLVERHPGSFEEERESFSHSGGFSPNGTRSRSVPSEEEVRDQVRRRTTRLRELEDREHTRRVPLTAEERFWHETERFLGIRVGELSDPDLDFVERMDTEQAQRELDELDSLFGRVA
jgi:hypothetical protein